MLYVICKDTRYRLICPQSFRMVWQTAHYYVMWYQQIETRQKWAEQNILFIQIVEMRIGGTAKSGAAFSFRNNISIVEVEIFILLPCIPAQVNGQFNFSPRHFIFDVMSPPPNPSFWVPSILAQEQRKLWLTGIRGSDLGEAMMWLQYWSSFPLLFIWFELAIYSVTPMLAIVTHNGQKLQEKHCATLEIIWADEGKILQT